MCDLGVNRCSVPKIALTAVRVYCSLVTGQEKHGKHTVGSDVPQGHFSWCPGASVEQGSLLSPQEQPPYLKKKGAKERRE